MTNKLIILAAILVFAGCNQKPKTGPVKNDGGGDTLLVLQNDSAILTFAMHGGAIVGFSLKHQPLNPFSWRMASHEMPGNNRPGAPFQGHFICTGRWGAPTQGEMAAGMPHNGEPCNSWWSLSEKASPLNATMEISAPLDEMKISRKVNLDQYQPCFVVDETFFNLQNTARFTTLVQHATIGAPFLNGHNIVSTNATKGFNQSLANPDPEEFSYTWPNGYADTLMAPLYLALSSHTQGFVTTHIVEDDIGWATVADTRSLLLLGYVWKTHDYPWLHIWHGVRDGKPWAKGIEFGTTGLGDNFQPEKRQTFNFFGHNNLTFLDANSNATKSYFCFLTKIPDGFMETRKVELSGNKVTATFLTKTGVAKKSFSSVGWQ